LLEHSLVDADQQLSAPTRFEGAGQYSVVLRRRFLANILWFMGYPNQALAHHQEALTLAQALAHPLTIANALEGAARLHYLRREVQATRTQAEVAMAYAQQQGVANPLERCRAYAGWALAQQGEVAAGIAQMREGIAARAAIHRHNMTSMYLAMLSETYGNASQPEEGLRLLDQTLAHVEAHGERFYEPELHRLRGALLHMQGADAEMVESHLLKALTLAQQQEAKSLELRAAVALARLYQQPGQRRQAHDLLAEVYGWFTEGFDTPDLQDAQALLAALA
jgi:predicted ATPase